MTSIYKPISILGICYDEKSSSLRGAAKAPPIIRQYLESDAGNSFAENGVDVSSLDVHNAGDFQINNYFDIEAHAKKVIEKQHRLLTFGGDHSITFPLIKAHYEMYGAMDILHIDAHADLYNQFEGDPYSHASPFARVMENGFASKLTQVGIRTFNTHQREQANRFDVNVIEMKDYELSKLPKFTKPIYISLDLDALDPAFAPGVSHREPGGFSTRELIALIQSINVPVIGADMVEYNPTCDIDFQTATVAAKLTKEVLSKMASE